MAVFMEFESSNYPRPGAIHVLVGKSVADIMGATRNGTMFGSAILSFRRMVPETEARIRFSGAIQDALDAIAGGQVSVLKLSSLI